MRISSLPMWRLVALTLVTCAVLARAQSGYETRGEAAVDQMEFIAKAMSTITSYFVVEVTLETLAVRVEKELRRTLANHGSPAPPADTERKPVGDDVTRVFDLIALPYEHAVRNSDIAMDSLMSAAIHGIESCLEGRGRFLSPDDLVNRGLGEGDPPAGIGLFISFANDSATVASVIEGGPAFEAGILEGDCIDSIGTTPTRGASPEEIMRGLRGAEGSPVEVSVRRNGERLRFSMTREFVKVSSVEHERLENGVGYLRIVNLQSTTGDQVATALAELGADDGALAGLVLDLRGNTGGLMKAAYDVVGPFLHNELIVYSKGRDGEVKAKYYGDKDNFRVRCPAIVLVDEKTASGAEVIAGALQFWRRALVVGVATAGEGDIDTLFKLPRGYALRLATQVMYFPDARPIADVGITPDVTIEDDGGLVERAADALSDVNGSEPDDAIARMAAFFTSSNKATETGGDG